MANHSSAVIGTTPLYLPIRVDNFYYAIELTTELTAQRRFLGKFCCFDVRGVAVKVSKSMFFFCFNN